MRGIFIVAAAISVGLCGAPLAAESIEEKNLIKDKVQIEQDQGYIFLRSTGRLVGTFVRIPDNQDIEEYQTARAEAFAKAVESYEKKHARWEKFVVQAERTRKRVPEEPVAPTEESFSIGAIERFTAISFGPLNVYSKDENRDEYTYLTRVKPGTYVWYGPVGFDNAQGYLGVCYCMGSIKFDVNAGEITDLGNFIEAAPNWGNHASVQIPTIRYSAGFSGESVELSTRSSEVSYERPDSLIAYEARVPEFTAVGKTNNFYGVMVSRIAPIQGVIAYERDNVIDVKSGKVLEVQVADD